MSFFRLLPLLLLLPALAMADSDKNFKIATKQFKAGTVVDPIVDMAIKGDKGVAVSEPLSFPLQENKIYYRHKKGPKEYQWMSGDLVVKNLKKLHAFSLKENYLRSEDVIKMRFYGSQNAKAFQDETDLYFDRKYIYSPRVPKLYFIKNGKWQLLKETTLPGAIEFSSDQKKFELASMKKAYSKTPTVLFPVSPGFHAYIFSAPGFMPYVDAGIVEEGSALTFKTHFVKIQQDGEVTKKPVLGITMTDVANTTTLESTEALYDKFITELAKVSDTMDKSYFEDNYPQLHTASSFSMSETDEKYAEYATRYNTKKIEAQQLWRESKVDDASELNKALRKKLDSLETLPLRGSMMPASIEPVFTDVPVDASVDSAKAIMAKASDSAAAPAAPAMQKQMTEFKLVFGTDQARFDFGWKGTVNGISLDTLYNWIVRRNPDLKVNIELQNNKPVWVYKSETVIWRHHYRYVGLEFQVGKDIYKGVGTFILPDYILSEREVQEWLRNKDKKEEPKKEEPKLVKDSVKITMPTIENLATSARIVRDKDRGSLAMLDSGVFRYKGHVVGMSPFAIMTTEMTQQLFDKTMQKVDSVKRVPDRSKFKHQNKPVHNITWDDARFVCQTLGGDLPSEAQWEFAARADNVEGAIWNKDSIPDPGSYAVYRGNSLNLGPRFDAYGPQPVGSKKPNAWGIHDMSGNVAEWTRDRYFMFSFVVEPSNPTGASIGSNKVYKGGSWKDGEKMLNVTQYDDEDPRYWSETIGFRCVYPIDIIKE